MTRHHFNEDKIAHYPAVDGIERNIHIWEADNTKAVFLCIHGGLSHGGDYETVGKYFRQQNIACVAPDLTGHSTNHKVVINSFTDFVEDSKNTLNWIKEYYPGMPIFIVGHSMGGLIATHLGLTHFKQDTDIKGYILSSPYYANKIPVAKLLVKLSGIASKLLPKLTVPLEDFTDQLTHDTAMQQRIYHDIEKGFRATKASSRFANELLTAQEKLTHRIDNWDKPLLVFIAGKDTLADSTVTHQLLQRITKTPITTLEYPQNFHENFNETNREEIFMKILNWIKQQ